MGINICYNHCMNGMKALKAQSAYSRPERPTNFITYALAAGLSFVGLVFLLIKAVPLGPSAIAGTSVFGVGSFCVFCIGALAHILPFCRAKYALIGIARNAASLLVCFAFAPVALYGLGGGTFADAVWGAALFAVAAACAVGACALTVGAADEYKLVRLFLYVVIVLACTVRSALIAELAGLGAFWFFIGGGAMYILGCVCGAWDALPARHCVMHLFFMCGAALHFVCAYVYVL